MALLSLLTRVFGPSDHAPVVEAERAQEDHRKVVLRCLGCNTWNRSRLVFMSNGGDYCLGCARQIARTYGYTVAGKRWTDITSLD